MHKVPQLQAVLQDWGMFTEAQDPDYYKPNCLFMISCEKCKAYVEKVQKCKG